MPEIKNKKTETLPSLSIVIPAYNEEESIEWLVKDTIANLPKVNITDFEIIIVDDGSTDRTSEISDELAKKFKTVRVIHKPNKGYCGAITTGIKEACKDYVVYFPADGQTLVRDFVKCLPYLGKADLILGLRGKRLDYSLYRLFISHIFLVLLWIFFWNPYRDVNWFHIWRRKEIQKMKIVSNGIFILAEIVIRFRRRGLKIAEASVPYRSRHSGKAKNAKLGVAFATLVDLLKFWILLRLGKID